MPHAIRIHAYGGPEQLHYEPVGDEVPGAGQVLVQHTAIGVNFIDTYHRTGLYPLPSLPHGLGGEAAGVVLAIGPDVVSVAAGDRVGYATVTPPGAYCQRRVVAIDKLIPLPRFVADQQAAALLLKGMTVESLVRRTFRVEAGMTVLLHAAAGGIGLLACQWLAALGATVIGTVSSDQKAELARAHGCQHTIVYTREDFVARVQEITRGKGAHVVYDGVGKSTLRGSLDCLRRRGMLVSFGNASGRPDPIDPLDLSKRGSLFLTRPSLFDYTATRAELLASASAVFELVRREVLAVRLGGRFPLAEAATAHRALESRETAGAIVLLP